MSKWLGICLSLLVFTACARSDRSILEKSQSYIDGRQYDQAIQLLEAEIPAHPNKELKTNLAYAYLGKSGVELMELAEQINFIKSFKSVEFPAEGFSVKCHDLAFYEGNASIPFICLPMIKFGKFPDPEDANFTKALALFNEINPDPASTAQEINLLLAILDVGSAIKNYNHLVDMPDEYIQGSMQHHRDMQIKAASYSLKYLKRTLDCIGSGLKHLMFSYGKIRRFFDHLKDKPLLTLGRYTYYATDRFSGDDFAQFLLSSGKEELEHQQAGFEQIKSTTLVGFTHDLKHVLYQLRLHLNADNDALGEFVNHIAFAGAYWLPKRANTNLFPKIQFQDLLNPKYLPKAVKRLADSSKQSWKQEDAAGLFDTIDSLHSQYYSMDDITTHWSNFWQQLGQSQREDIRQETETLKRDLPEVEIDANGKVDLKKLSEWNDFIWNRLHQFSKQMQIKYPDEPMFSEYLPSLLDQSDRWIKENLY